MSRASPNSKPTLMADANWPCDDSRERTILSDDQLAAGQCLVIAINAFNRVAATSGFDVNPETRTLADAVASGRWSTAPISADIHFRTDRGRATTFGLRGNRGPMDGDPTVSAPTAPP